MAIQRVDLEMCAEERATMRCKVCKERRNRDDYELPGRGEYVQKRRRLIRDLIATGEYESAHVLKRVLLLKDWPISSSLLHADLKAMEIMSIPTEHPRKRLLALPQGKLICLSCEKAAVQAIGKRTSLDPFFAKENGKHFCLQCNQEQQIQEFEGKVYCSSCGEPARSSLDCEICSEIRPALYMIPGKGHCIYCAMNRRRFRDLLDLRDMRRGNERVRDEIRTYVRKNHKGWMQKIG